MMAQNVSWQSLISLQMAQSTLHRNNLKKYIAQCVKIHNDALMRRWSKVRSDGEELDVVLPHSKCRVK